MLEEGLFANAAGKLTKASVHVHWLTNVSEGSATTTAAGMPKFGLKYDRSRLRISPGAPNPRLVLT